MNILPTTLEDVTDLPLHYFEFFTTLLHKLAPKLDTSKPSDSALHKAVVFFMRAISNVQLKSTSLQEFTTERLDMLRRRKRFMWNNELMVSRSRVSHLATPKSRLNTLDCRT